MPLGSGSSAEMEEKLRTGHGHGQGPMGALPLLRRKYFVWADARKAAKNKTERREIEEARTVQQSRQDLSHVSLGS